MKSKTIKSIISRKLKDWHDSIKDDKVLDLIRRNTIVTGGCITSMLLKEKINDFDVYFKDRETAMSVAEYYISEFKQKKKLGINCPISIDENCKDRIKIIIKSSGIASENGSEKPYEYFENRPEGLGGEYVEDIYQATNEDCQITDDGDKYRPIFISANAITLSHEMQIITRFYGDPAEIHKNFDFVHCTNYFTSWDSNLRLNLASLEAILAKELKYVGSKYPLCSLIRIRKFIKRGWTINAGQILKAVMQLQELNLKDPLVLEDQLTGVDSAYFVEIIRKIKEKNPEKVDSSYLSEIIDRMF